MVHLGWFFAGTSFGLFVGVLVTSLAKISDMAQEMSFPPDRTQTAGGNVLKMQTGPTVARRRRGPRQAY
jgi:hypothetical protein